MAKAPTKSGGAAKPRSAKAQAKYHKYAATKAVTHGKARQAKQQSASASLKKGSWEKVQIAGNLVTDDGGGLEGLIGLEVLEDYGSAVVATSGKRTYSDNDLDEDFQLLTKADRKQRRAEQAERDAVAKDAKRSKLRAAAERKAAAGAGAFVRAAKVAEEEQDGEEEEEVQEEEDSEPEPESEAEEAEETLYQEDDVSDLEMEDDDEDDEEAAAEKPLSADDLTTWKTLGVHQLIRQSLAEKRFLEPTVIQLLTLPAAIYDKKDILGAAETGSGKTLAFGIPILNGILELRENGGAEVSVASGRRAPKVSEVEEEEEEAGEEVVNAQASGKRGKKRKLVRRGERDNMTPPPEELLFAPPQGKGKKARAAQLTQPDGDSADEAEEEEADPRPLYALVLTPTRELCVQVRDHLVAAAKYTGIQVAAIFGGMAHVKQERVLRKCPEIVVATPGRLWELIRDGNRHLNKLRDISYLVIDETDRMVEKGHFEELKLIIGQLNADAERQRRRQNFVFSATLTLVHELPAYVKGKKQKQAAQTAAQKIHALIAQLGIQQPKVVDITKSTGTAERLTECRIVCELAQKDWYLYYFLQRHPGRTIVFCNSIDCVKRLGQLFTLLDCQPRPLHAHMNQRQRLKNLERFTASPTGLLIATDVAARGLDIPDVRHVIHYQVPRTGENYVHRSGRTARAQHEGLSLMMMEPAEVRVYMNLCRTLKRTEDLPLFPCSERHLKAVKARVDLAREVDILDLRSRRSAAEIGWLKKSAEEMDILVDDMSDFSETELYDSDDGGERYRGKRELRQKRDNLNKLLGQPLFAKGFSYKYPSREGRVQDGAMQEASAVNAVEVMKSAIVEYAADKKRRNKKVKGGAGVEAVAAV